MPSGKEAQNRASSEQIWKPNQCNVTRKKTNKKSPRNRILKKGNNKCYHLQNA